MIGSADAENPIMVGAAAYVASTVVESDRAVTQCLTEWSEVQVEVDEDGLVIGHKKYIGIDKRDRTQQGKWKGTPQFKKRNNRALRAATTDFERFQVMLARKERSAKRAKA